MSLSASHVFARRSTEAPFIVASFVGASLIFWLEPLFAKMMLPAFGGSAAVWTTALMFYQAVLLAGYGYSHLLTRLGRPRQQAAVHLAVLAVAGLVSLPPAVPATGWFDPVTAPVLAALYSLTVGLGLPLCALSATAPLLQRWFSQTGDAGAADPYFLYAASNAGSLLALLAFPFVLEPLLGLTAQRGAWTAGFALLAVLLTGCAVLARAPLPAAAPTHGAPTQGANAQGAPAWRIVLLAAVPSSLLAGVTTTITTDVASAPLFWTVPLALYLLTFILAFARAQVIPHAWALRLQAIFLVAAVVPSLVAALAGTGIAIVGLLLAFFFAALVCHGELARGRPPAERLTQFYLAMAVGGLLGGSFNALVAPSVFTGIVEFPLALVLAVALRPGRQRPRDLLWPAAAFAAVAAALLLSGQVADQRWLVLAAAVLALGAVVLAARPWPAAAMVAGAFALPLLPGAAAPALDAERNFFGLLRVYQDPMLKAHVLKHGTTIHGMQLRDGIRDEEPLAYYHPAGPLGEALAALPEARRGAAAVIGLGAGSIACYLREAAAVTFYEIDPAVVRVATSPDRFSFVSRCRPDAAMEVGDGRLRLAASPHRHSLIVLDAFSSDAIPAHLLTREAMRLYADRLAPGGVLMAHFTNRYLDLAPVLGALAQAEGMATVARCARGGDAALTYRACWAALARDARTLAPLAGKPGWAPLPAGAAPWTDDYSDFLAPLLRRLRAGGESD